jgi:hypothetical protein
MSRRVELGGDAPEWVALGSGEVGGIACISIGIFYMSFFLIKAADCPKFPIL